MPNKCVECHGTGRGWDGNDLRQCVKCGGRGDDDSLHQRIKTLELENRQLRANHAEMIRRNALLRTRTDLDGDLVAKRCGYEMSLTEALARIKELENKIS